MASPDGGDTGESAVRSDQCHPLMSLEDLLKYVPAQTKAISQISLGVDSTTGLCTFWNQFREIFWGKSLNLFQKEEPIEKDTVGPVEDVHILPESRPGTRSVIKLPMVLPDAWNIDGGHLLVRAEYTEAEKAAVSSSESSTGAFVVTGQSGIGLPPFSPLSAESNARSGKSLFLLWLLIRRLGLQLPTALQINRSYAILFHQGGVFEFTHLDWHPGYDVLFFPPDARPSRIWALFDSNPLLPEPASIFRYFSAFFVVDAAPPCSHYTDWLSKVGYEEFYMKTWTFSEVIKAYVGLASSGSRRSRLL